MYRTPISVPIHFNMEWMLPIIGPLAVIPNSTVVSRLAKTVAINLEDRGNHVDEIVFRHAMSSSKNG